jgi:hypothetical protein
MCPRLHWSPMEHLGEMGADKVEIRINVLSQLPYIHNIEQ